MSISISLGNWFPITFVARADVKLTNSAGYIRR